MLKTRGHPAGFATFCRRRLGSSGAARFFRRRNFRSQGEKPDVELATSEGDLQLAVHRRTEPQIHIIPENGRIASGLDERPWHGARMRVTLDNLAARK
jgi:hypothetical protein